jgi:transposase InsO family protein
VKAVAETLKVSRSNLILRQNGSGKERKAYTKADDAVLLPAIRGIVDDRPTYGYRRVGALLNRERRNQGLPALNHKRLYRVMSQNGLLLARQPQKRSGRPHDVVKTFKRDYVRVHDRPDAATVLAQLDRWFNDYNESHPHKGLKMKSPREFTRAQLAAGCPI